MTQDRQARAQRLLTLAEETGLSEVLPVRCAKPNANPGEDYDKLFVVPNAAGIRSVELWYPVTTTPYLKITHSDRIPERWKAAIDAVGEAAASHGHRLVSRPLATRIEGNPRRSMTLLAEALHGLDVDSRSSHATAAPAGMEASRPDTAAQPLARDDAGPGAPAPSVSTTSARDCAELLAQIDQRILDFVEQPGNGALGARMRSDSTPFRSTLFGKTARSEVAEALASRSADVLLLIANPNHRGQREGEPRVRTLQEQIRSGHFGEAYFDRNRCPVPGWSAQSDPKVSWRRVMRSIEVAGMDPAAVANYLPWGSRDLPELGRDCDQALLARMLAFAGERLGRIVTLLRPRPIVTVRSLSSTRGLEAGRVATHQRGATRLSLSVPTLAGGTKPVHLDAGPLELAGWRCFKVHTPHPGYLQLTKQAEPMFERELTRLLRRGVDHAAA